MAGYTYTGVGPFDAGGKSEGRRPIQHGTTHSQYNRCKNRELGACADCKATVARIERRRRARTDPRNIVLRALQALVED